MILKDKVCMVTGAARGIGRAIALNMLEEGAIVYGCDLTSGSIDDIELTNERFHSLYFDVTDQQGSKEALMRVKKEQGHLDILVNNAGVVFNSRIGMITREKTELMLRVNVIAVMEMTQLASRIMSRTGGGSIVNIASVTALQGSPGQAAYSASKGAVISFTKSAAKELAPLGIRVNAVAPGIVKTELFDQLYNADGNKIDLRIERIALGRLATPEDVAHAVCFLASDKASYISGQILGVDGCASI